MKALCSILFVILVAPILVNAEDGKVLYYKSEIAGPQITKAYYTQKSIKKVDPKNPRLFQVDTQTLVKSPEGKSEYRVTYQINCNEKKITRVKFWSSGFGYDNGLMVNGKWDSVTDYEDASALAQKICSQ